MSTNWLLVAFWVGCGAPITAKNAGKGGDSGGEVDEDASDTDGGTPGAQLPSISYAQAVCEAAPAREWTFVATASDPQGIDSLSAIGAVEVYSDDIWVSAHTLSLDTASQRYLASVSVEEVGVPCTRAADYSFSFTVTDEDGNVSDPTIVSGETD